MSGLKSLAKDTAIYGMSSIVGRFLNYLLVPLYTAKMSAASGGYGIVTNIYAMTALLLVILTYGMETGFFRYVNKKDCNPDTVYSTVIISVGTTSLLFTLLCYIFLGDISSLLGYAEHPEYIMMMACVVAMDAFQNIPFAYLRHKKKALKFAAIKFVFIIPNILLNLFFFIACPYLLKHYPGTVDWFYSPSYGVGYVFVANLICTGLQMLCLMPADTRHSRHTQPDGRQNHIPVRIPRQHHSQCTARHIWSHQQDCHDNGHAHPSIQIRLRAVRLRQKQG